MSTQEARIVKAHIDDKGTVEEIDDPFYEHFWDPDTRLDRALEEEHYGWTLKPYLEKGIIIAPVFPGTVDICTNDPDDTAHLNTICAQRPELVKLDVGYWGEYTREHNFLDKKKNPEMPAHAPPQRNFGMIQGRDVWLCNYSGAAAATGNTSLPADDSPAGKLLAYLKSKSLNVEFIMHALAPCTPFTNDLDAETLYLLFSDLHLPERFPDAPESNKLATPSDSSIRAQLRLQMRRCQHEFGLLAGNRHMDSGKADTIQQYLEGAVAGATKLPTIPDIDKSLTPQNFLAEKNILDRTIRTRSCWFYGPWDGKQTLEDGDHEKPATPARMSSAPAVDLAILLAAVLKTQKAGAAIRVIQLGDLYEMWMGREFLYLDFPVTDSFDTLSIPRATLTALQGKFHFAGGENDEFQYRFDEDWSDGRNLHPVKRYPFHQWAKSDMLKRHKSGWHYLEGGSVNYEKMAREGVTSQKLSRIRARLAERAVNVEGFSLPEPEGGCQTLKDVLADVDLDLDAFKRTSAEPGGISPVPPDEFLWHGLIFKLFRDLDFRNIHGNHDGYRSDPALSGSFIAAEEWISLPGIWIEHGHRWDEYNRDGCAIGAGVTNMVYYHNKSMLDSDRGSTVKDWFMPQDQKCFMPGAAQWYLLVNMTKHEFKSRDQSQTVLPFGIVVMGHTHHPDLCYIRYEKEGSWLSAAVGAVTAAEKVVEAGKKVEKFVSDKVKQAEDALASAKAKLKAAEEELARAKARAESAIGDARQKAQDALNQAKAQATEAANKAKAAADDALLKVKAAEAEVERAKTAVADAAARAQAAAAKEAGAAADSAKSAASHAANQAKSAIPGKPPLPDKPKLPF